MASRSPRPRLYAGSRMGAPARVGCLLGAGRPVGPDVRGLASGLGGFSWWLEFLEEVAVHHYYKQKIIT
jgi:hypothetical protein